jgi:glyoxylase-like metal-dependent hydrolase (beta-lactamase superfamily II)
MLGAFVSRQLRSLSLVVVTGAAACEAPPELTELTGVTELNGTVLALGGLEAVSAVTNERVVAHGDRYFPGQGASHTESRHLSTFNYVRTTELDTDQLHIDHDHEHDYLYDGRYRFTEVVDGASGFVAGQDAVYPSPAQSAMLSSRITAELQHARLISPLRLVREVLADPSRVIDRGTRELDGRRYLMLAIAGPGERPLELLIDPRTHLPALARQWEDNPPIGDTLIEARFDDYRRVDGVAVPYRVDLRANGLPLHSERRSSVALNVPTGPQTYAVPDAFRPPAVSYEPRLGELGERSFELMTNIKYLALPVFFFDQDATPVGFNELAPGVMHVTGITHNSLLIEMSDHLVLVDASTPFAVRSQAVLAEIERRYPTKPIRYVVVSHFHNDHSGGIRHFVAGGGVTVLVGAPSAPFYDRVLANPHTVHPDRLAEQPVPVGVKPVEDREVLGGAGRTIEVRRVRTTHANDMLVVYLPGEKLLFNADLLSPDPATNGAPIGNPKLRALAAELHDEVIRLGLDVETIAGAHGQGTATLDQLRIAAGR